MAKKVNETETETTSAADQTGTKKRRRRTSAPENETKNERFRRVCGLRATKAIDAINAIGKCSGSGYEYSDEEIAKLGDALVNAVNGVLNKFKVKTDADDKTTGSFFG